MRVLIQRVNVAKVTVADQIVGAIERGLLIFVAIAPTDTNTELDWMVRKCLDLRLFPQPDTTEGKWDCSVQEIQGDILIVSQFTLYGDCRKGRRPSFSGSAPPQQARELYEQFVSKFQGSGLKIATGEFGANMQVQIENDGPVTLWLEKEASNKL